MPHATKPQIMVRMLINLKHLYVRMRSFPQARDVAELLRRRRSVGGDRAARPRPARVPPEGFSGALRDLQTYLQLSSTHDPSETDREELAGIWEHVKTAEKARRVAELTAERRHGTRDTGHGTRDTEHGHGTRNTGHGTRDTGKECSLSPVPCLCSLSPVSVLPSCLSPVPVLSLSSLYLSLLPCLCSLSPVSAPCLLVPCPCPCLSLSLLLVPCPCPCPCPCLCSLSPVPSCPCLCSLSPVPVLSLVPCPVSLVYPQIRAPVRAMPSGHSPTSGQTGQCGSASVQVAPP